VREAGRPNIIGTSVFEPPVTPPAMVEKPERHRVGERPRGVDEPEWEVFVREDRTDPLGRVGSVSAPAADVAYEQAAKLFARYASDVWVCPAGEVRRYSTRALDAEAGPVPVDDGREEPRAYGP